MASPPFRSPLVSIHRRVVSRELQHFRPVNRPDGGAVTHVKDYLPLEAQLALHDRTRSDHNMRVPVAPVVPAVVFLDDDVAIDACVRSEIDVAVSRRHRASDVCSFDVDAAIHVAGGARHVGTPVDVERAVDCVYVARDVRAILDLDSAVYGGEFLRCRPGVHVHASIHCVGMSDNRIGTYVDAPIDGGDITGVLTRSNVD